MRPLRVGLLAALPLLAGVALGTHLVQARAGAQSRPLIIGAVYNAGVGPGQFLRLAGFNPHPAQAGVIEFQLYAADGTLACQSGRVSVPPLETVYIDVPRESSHLGRLSGDPGTGRVQLGIVAATPLLRPGRGGDPAPSVIPSLELVDSSTGRTLAMIANSHVIKDLLPSPPPGPV